EYCWWLEIALRSEIVTLSEPLHDFRIHSANRQYNTSPLGPQLVKLALRLFLHKYGLPAIVSTLAQRSESSRAEIYRHLTSALSQDLLPTDLVLFADAFRCEDDNELAAITDSARTAQAVQTIGNLNDFGVRSERLVLTLLNRAKDNYKAGRFEAASAQLQNLLKVSKRFPDLDLSARYYLALSLEQSHDVTGAETLFQSILAATPDHAKAAEGLARIRNGKTIAADQLACC
ncbi:MAG: tetratricopeptide repeat protein, partial [Acidobacteria bacterium]|nr:tetratricopeptide repeat protein [Acidobacteriota bacterium]